MKSFDDVVINWVEPPPPLTIPIWKLLVSLLIADLILVGLTIIISLFRPVPIPFAVSAINLLQAAHVVISLAIYIRTRHKDGIWGLVQFVLASLTHLALFVGFALLSIIGLSTEWSILGAISLWFLWETTVLLALRKLYKKKPTHEQRFLLLNTVAYGLYTLGLIGHIILYVIPPSILQEKTLLWLLVQGVLLGSALVFVGLLLLHVRKLSIEIK